MANTARRVGTLLGVQLLLLVITSVVFLWLYGVFQAGSVWFGGCIAISSALWLEWRRYGIDRGRALSAAESMRALTRTVLERFAWVVLLFVLALSILRLDPAALIAGFIAGQLALFLIGIVGTD